MAIKHFVLKFRFLEEYCSYPNHFCNGKHVPYLDADGNDMNKNIPDTIPCPYYNKKRCHHPEHRFNSKGEGL